MISVVWPAWHSHAPLTFSSLLCHGVIFWWHEKMLQLMTFLLSPGQSLCQWDALHIPEENGHLHSSRDSCLKFLRLTTFMMFPLYSLSFRWVCLQLGKETVVIIIMNYGSWHVCTHICFFFFFPGIESHDTWSAHSVFTYWWTITGTVACCNSSNALSSKITGIHCSNANMWATASWTGLTPYLFIVTSAVECHHPSADSMVARCCFITDCAKVMVMS